MKKSLVVTILLAIQLVSMAAAGWAASEAPIRETFTFTNSLAPWIGVASNKGCEAADILSLGEGYEMKPSDPNRYALLTRTCGGIVWMVARIQMEGTEFNVSFDARNIDGCEGCIPIVYVGKSAPYSVIQFGTDFQSLSSSWETHKMAVNVSGPDKPGPGGVYVAIGFANLDMERPDLTQVVGIDNITVTAAEGCEACTR
jgi:hypothetical protein